MRLIIAGSRTCNDIDEVRAAVFAARAEWDWCPITEVVSGGAAGVDRFGEQLAREDGIPIKVFPADWNSHGKAAGPIRNREMAEYGDALVAVWDGKSRGTKNMIDEAKAKNRPVYIHTINNTESKSHG